MRHVRSAFLIALAGSLLAPATVSAERRAPSDGVGGAPTSSVAEAAILPSLQRLMKRIGDETPVARHAVPAPPGSRGPVIAADEPAPRSARGTSRAPVLNPATPASFSTPSRNYAGISGFTPPDPIGDVGPNHYVQAVNVSFAIYAKADTSGTPVLGPTNLGTFFAPLGFPCTRNDGDPVVVYDQLAGRWILAQFASNVSGPSRIAPFRLCVGLSDTSDPTGSWKQYAFDTGVFPDYFKVGVWPDAYYVTWNQGSVGIAALERSQMLVGGPAEIVRTSVAGPNPVANMMLPADADGDVPPPAGAPGLVYHHVDSALPGAGGVDRLHVHSVTPTFNGSPSTIGLSPPASIPVSAFDGNFCGNVAFASCIPQPGTAQKLDPIMEWPMWRFQYRNVGTHEMLVGNFLEDVGSVDRAGIRWFELRKTGAGPWTLFQEGTHSPDLTGRWMGSVAMDGAGNIALGYSASDATSTFPSLWYAGRAPTDPVGTLPLGEVQLVGGTASQTDSDRWGDYASMNVDPVDDCTFWFTGEYATNAAGRETRIGSFRLCSALTVALGGPGTGTIVSTPGGITCPGLCRGSFNPGTSVQLVAQPAIGSFFRGWTGGGCSGTGPCTIVTGADDTQVTAEFGAAGRRQLKLKAKPRKPSPKQRITLRVKDKSTSGFLATCDHKGDKVKFQRKAKGWKTIAKRKLNGRCAASLRTRITQTTRYRVLVPAQDADHTTSKKAVRVKVV